MERGWTGRCAVWVPPLLLVYALVLIAPRPARADEPESAEQEKPAPDQAPPQAISHYERGREHFRAGRYGEAIVELKAALALDPSSPNLLYNVAYTSELLGNLHEAIDYYRKYLVALPESRTADREKVLETLRRLEGRRATQPPPAARTSTAPPPATRGFGRADLWFWTSLGSGAALLAGGAVTGVLALQRQSEVRGFVAGPDGTLAKRQGLINQANTLALSCDILTGAGAALVVTAGLLFFLRDPAPTRPRDSTAPKAGLVTDGRAALLTLSGAF
jgi:tetratricopeptide (TPR) repeat protein